MPIRLAIALLAALLASTPLRADDDQDKAQAALQRGEIKPLDEVMAAAKARVPGEIAKIELERDDGRWTYEFKILTPDGARREVEIDASTLEILEID